MPHAKGNPELKGENKSAHQLSYQNGTWVTQG